MGIKAGEDTFYQSKRAIPQNGLLVCLDGAVRESYPRTGSSWNNLASDTYNGTLYNSPSFTKEYGGGINCDGTNENMRYNIVLPYSLTFIVWARSNQDLWSNYAGLGSARYQNGFIIHNWLNSKNVGYFIMNGSLGASYTGISDYTPSDVKDVAMYAISTNGSNIHKSYYNDTLISTNTTTISRTESPSIAGSLNSCSDYQGSRYNNMKMYSQYLYNRQLSDNEVYQVFNATRHRFGV